jgi:hypothetical protein
MIRIERACLDLPKQLETCENVDESLKEFKEFLFHVALEATYGPGIWNKIEEIKKKRLTN